MNNNNIIKFPKVKVGVEDNHEVIRLLRERMEQNEVHGCTVVYSNSRGDRFILSNDKTVDELVLKAFYLFTSAGNALNDNMEIEK